MALSSKPSRLITDREMARIVMSLIGSCIPLMENGANSAKNVVQHIAEFKDEYMSFFSMMETLKPKTPTEERDPGPNEFGRRF